jgi:hypothetical protein
MVSGLECLKIMLCELHRMAHDVLELNLMRVHANLDPKLRKIQNNCKCTFNANVIFLPCSFFRTVLQMPRGNLETIQPRLESNL